MKTIRASKFKDQIWRGGCSICDAIFECDREEINDKIKTPTRYGTRDGDDYAILACSECGNHTVNFKHYQTSPLRRIS